MSQVVIIVSLKHGIDAQFEIRVFLIAISI